MKVKVYEAPTMQEAIAKVKRDLGSDAVILFTKKYPVGGFWGFFRKERVEVTAGLEINTIGSASSFSSRPARKVKQPLLPRPSTAPPLPPSMSPKEAPLLTTLQKEILEIKEVLKNITNSPDDEFCRADQGNMLLKEIEELLVEKEVDPKVVKKFMGSLAMELPLLQNQNMETARRLLSEKIGREVITSGPIKLSSSAPKIVALVGPTGVGKTTTLAKIAADFTLLKQKKVVFVTADTYRIAAVEQLKVFGDIVDIPVEVTSTPMGLKRIVQKHRDKDLILIDTAGRSPKNEERISQLKKLLAGVENLEVHLTLSATTGKKDLLAIIDQFKPTNFHRLLFTKLDESTGLGAVLNVAMQVDCPISYFTTGQNVPDDIEIAHSDRLSTLVLN